MRLQQQESEDKLPFNISGYTSWHVYDQEKASGPLESKVKTSAEFRAEPDIEIDRVDDSIQWIKKMVKATASQDGADYNSKESQSIPDYQVRSK